MATQTVSSLVNDLLIELHRSLAVYAADAISPWTPNENNDGLATIKEVAQIQTADVQRLTKYLQKRHQHIEWGAYPTAYSGLHFVGIGYLLSKVIENQTLIIQIFTEALDELTDDLEALSLVKAALNNQQDCLKELQTVASKS